MGRKLTTGLTLALLLLAACGGSSQGGSASAKRSGRRSATSTPTTPATAVGPQPAPPPSVTYMISGSAADGSTESVQLEFWNPAQAVDTYKPWIGWSAPTACQVDQQRDALIPGRVMLTNTTSGFSADVALQLNQVGSPPGADSLQAEEQYTSGAQCGASGGATFFVSSNGQLSPGQSETLNFLVIVPGYYSPTNPQGDPALLNQYALDTELASTAIDYNDVTVVGPGVKPATSVFKPDVTLTGSDASATNAP